MNAIRVQILLKHFVDENSSKQFHNFWYAFQPSKLLTVKDILEDIRLNYLKEQDERAFVIHLDDCQVLPFTSSQILRDNDRLTLMPLTKYQLDRKSLEDSVNLNLSSSIAKEPSVLILESKPKRQRIESTGQNIPTESTITITAATENTDEQPRKKKTNTKSNEDQIRVSSVAEAIPQSPVTQTTSKPAVIRAVPEPPVIETTPQILKESTIETETNSEAPLSLPSTNGRIRELKSKTPAWKAQPPQAKGHAQDKLHIRFDSDSDEEPPSQPQTSTTIEEETTAKSLPLVNGSNSSVRIHYIPTPEQPVVIKTPSEPPNKKKTIDLLFEMKQHKTIPELQAKKIQQQFGKNRAQQRKRALSYLSMANFVDQAFGLDKSELEKQISSNEYPSSSSTSPQTLPTSFNKLARLPLVAEAIDNNEKIYDLYPPITQWPTIQTRIAFKLLELSEDFCPKMSEFKEGTVTNVNQSTGEVTIQLDKPLQTVFSQPSKFFAPLDELQEEEEEEQLLTTITVPFSDLNSVRLLSSSNGHTST